MAVLIHWLLGGWHHRGLIVHQRVTDPINILQTKMNILVWKDSNNQTIQKSFGARKATGSKQDSLHLNRKLPITERGEH